MELFFQNAMTLLPVVAGATNEIVLQVVAGAAQRTELPFVSEVLRCVVRV